MNIKSVYFQGESIVLKSAAGTESRCFAVCGESTHELTKADGVWSVRILTSEMSGTYHLRIFKQQSDGEVMCEEAKRIVIAPSRSAHRDRAEALQNALDAWAKNPNATVTVGEISISSKNVEQIRAEYQTELTKAEDEEAGRFLTGGIRVIKSRF